MRPACVRFRYFKDHFLMKLKFEFETVKLKFLPMIFKVVMVFLKRQRNNMLKNKIKQHFYV